MNYYHVSLMSNLESIMEKGLIPQIGERSVDIGETVEAVYLFPSFEDMENALMNWLGEWYIDEYDEDVPLMSLEISLPDDFPIKDGEVEYEKISEVIISPKYIKFLREE